MSDFLGRLAARSLGVAPVVEPAVAPMFAAAAAGERFELVQESGHDIMARGDGDSHSPDMPTPVMKLESVSLPQRHEPVNGKTVSPDPRPIAALPPVGLEGTPPELGRTVEASHLDTNAGIASQPQQPARAAFESVVPGIQQPSTPPVPAVFYRLEREAPPRFAAQTRLPAPDAPTAAPVIRVSIGRVEVRAEFPAPPARTGPKQSQPPALSIEEYARQRSERKR